MSIFLKVIQFRRRPETLEKPNKTPLPQVLKFETLDSNNENYTITIFFKKLELWNSIEKVSKIDKEPFF